MGDYVGYGPERGVRVAEEEAFDYACSNWVRLPREERDTLDAMIASGVTALELTEWYFSGCFTREDTMEQNGEQATADKEAARPVGRM